MGREGGNEAGVCQPGMAWWVGWLFL